MMYLRDSLRLARAKLRLRRVRMAITVFVASLVFAVLVFFGLFMQGVSNSLQSFGEEGLGNRYILQANPMFDSFSLHNSAELIEKLKPVQRSIVAQKTAAAKKLNIEYSEEQDMHLPLSVQNETDSKYYVNMMHPESQRLIANKVNAIGGLSFDSFKKLSGQYGAKSHYTSADPMFGTQTFGVSGQVNLIHDDKEQVSDEGVNDNFGSSSGVPQGVETIVSGWYTHDKDILKSFLLPGQNLEVGGDGSIPVVAPVSAAEDALGLKPLPATATQQEKLDRVVAVREGISGKTIELCYRNSASNQLIEEAKQQIKEAQKRKDDPSYVIPALRYGLPDKICGAVKIVADTRSYDEKKFADDNKAFEKQFGTLEEPVQGIVRVRIVGLTPDMDFGTGFSVTTIVNILMQSTLGSGWYSPRESIVPDSLAAQIALYEETPVGPTTSVYYAEFENQSDAIAFAKSQHCSVNIDFGAGGQFDLYMGDPRTTKCHAEGKYFDVYPFGSNQIAFEVFRQDASKVVRYIGIGVLLVASLILMGIIGKVIADSRRETAVFRALGASRFAIVQIYSVYTLFIALFVGIVSGILGYIGVYIVNQMVVEQASVTAVIAYNAEDIHKQFTVIGIDYLFGLFVLGMIVLAAFISMALPMLANMRRNPINDMRDEG